MVCPARWNCADTTHSFDVLRTVCTVRAQPLMWELSLSRKPTYCFYLVCVRGQSLSHVWLFTTPWTGALEAPLSMECSRQECWSGLPFPTPGDLPDPGVKPASPHPNAKSPIPERQKLKKKMSQLCKINTFTLPLTTD